MKERDEVLKRENKRRGLKDDKARGGEMMEE